MLYAAGLHEHCPDTEAAAVLEDVYEAELEDVEPGTVYKRSVILILLS